MPAAQTVQYTRNGYVEISINPLDEPENVYFTEDSPRFDLIIRNKTDRRVLTARDRENGLRWILGIGPTGEKKISSGVVDLDIQPRGVQTERIQPGLLSYETNAVIGVTGVSIIDDDPLQFYVGPQDTIRKTLYTFTIWDRSHYDAVHEQPKNLQKWVVRLSGLVVALALLQLVVGLFQIGVLSL